jgi:hypothetical protein
MYDHSNGSADRAGFLIGQIDFTTAEKLVIDCSFLTKNKGTTLNIRTISL